MNRLNVISETIAGLPDISIIEEFVEQDSNITGRVSVSNASLEEQIEFNVLILPPYPFKSNDFESIKFLNLDLLKYSHVMGDGSVCIHTAHSPSIIEKINLDFNSLKLWVQRYIVSGQGDIHYEHIITSQRPFKGSFYSYFFASVEYQFTPGEFGYVDYSPMSVGRFRNEIISSSIIQAFRDKGRQILATVNWNQKLKALALNVGIFLFLDKIPARFGRLAYTSWNDLFELLSQDFLEFLHRFEKEYHKNKGNNLPIMLGYRISEKDIHWEAVMLEIGTFPIYGVKQEKVFVTNLRMDAHIDWGLTRNCSSEYFFGRGTFSDQITKGKILIIGIGAVGSMVAKTLARCGCVEIHLIDFDIKEPENVCRSEYSFTTGINNKIDELSDELLSISPFIKVALKYDFAEAFNYYLKSFCNDGIRKQEIMDFLNSYTIVFDCSADNDLLYVISRLGTNSTILNLSISNHAKSLVCAVEANRYEFVQNQFQRVLNYDMDDLYNPIGCWNATFKASYNDINTLVQYSLKHINLRMRDCNLKNFVIDTDTEDGLTIKLKEF